MAQEITRIGVSLPENLLQRFDEIISDRGYSTRSEGIRDAVRNYIVDYEWTEEEGELVGVVTYIYDHHQRVLEEGLTDLQHSYINVIVSSVHVHLDEENCLETLIVRGDSKSIRGLADSIMSMRGVKHVKLIGTSTGKLL